MPAPIPQTVKSKVIEMWLLGYSRDSIASANNVSTGAVSNVVKEWEDKIGKDVMRGLRELGILLKKEGLSPAQCAIGFRITKIFAGQGVNVEDAEHFVSGIYEECSRLGFTPSNIVTHIKDLTIFSKEKNVRLPEIEAYIDKELAQSKQLADRVKQLNADIANLEEKKLELVKSRDRILEQTGEAQDQMKQYLNLKQEFEKRGISITDDVAKFANTVKSIAEYGYDPQMVLDEFEDIQNLQEKRRALKMAVGEKQEELQRLESMNSSLLRRISLHSSKADVYNELDNIGFGIKELKRLLDTVKNIAMSNQINYWLAIGKFFNDVERQYDVKLGFESEIAKLSTKIEVLTEQREKMLNNLTNQPFVGPIITKLLNFGLNESDILEVAKILFNILKSSFAIKDIALGMIEAVEEMVVSRTRTISDAKTIEILGRAREELAKLD